jgi:hypothetical protein
VIDCSYAPQQDARQHGGKALLSSAFSRLKGKSPVHQYLNLELSMSTPQYLLKITQSVTQYGEIKRVKCINSAFHYA